MTLTSTTKAMFVKDVLSYINVRALNRMADAKRLTEVLSRVQRLSDAVTPHQAMVAYAVEWSVQSLRLSQEAEQALLAMNVRQLVGLVYDLQKICTLQIEVTYKLNAMYATNLRAIA